MMIVGRSQPKQKVRTLQWTLKTRQSIAKPASLDCKACATHPPAIVCTHTGEGGRACLGTAASGPVLYHVPHDRGGSSGLRGRGRQGAGRNVVTQAWIPCRQFAYPIMQVGSGHLVHMSFSVYPIMHTAAAAADDDAKRYNMELPSEFFEENIG
eukprot:1159846-Pelagomonas_calceolata.AAC.13